MNVAIVMPYYNDKDLLLKSVISILGQSYLNWKLFLIDDGSKEENKAQNILGRDITKRVKIINKENGGVSSARNAALDLIRQDSFFKYVAYCDADDRWGEHYLSSQLKAIEDCDLVYSDAINEFVDGSPAIPYGISNPDIYPGMDMLIKSNFIYISSVLHKVKCLSVGNFDSNLNSIEDWDMWVRIAKAGYKIKKNSLEFIKYIVKNEGNMASKRTDDIYKRFIEKHNIR